MCVYENERTTTTNNKHFDAKAQRGNRFIYACSAELQQQQQQNRNEML